MNLIAIETATELCSVGLLHQGHITDKKQLAPRQHADLVLGYLDDLLNAQGISKSAVDGIVFGQGPGAFTGVRIAMSVVQGLALAWEVPVVAISTLHNMAHQLWQQNPEQQGKLLIANDARMGEVYWATFEISDGHLKRLTEDSLAAPEAIDTAGFEVCSGSAFKSMLEAPHDARVLPDSHPEATTLLHIVKQDFPQQAQHIIHIQPSYIREKVVFN
ncbi:tRNA (adenosine(37)-N6)-threonylcarbamoyltransferase complex dimerization subunit type 1 TsaB [Marinicella sediminis]|uniref:tRNA threonylcarbamoyladenosine biosynthesis protein TsaB n=1 Tax=Marinicella sediminis TaxID=1792834 RepID=A0ABV7J803_9GAMM|nr:tRNA (adenosine(37)-N6)-threonylcarbamoyltransferase complex dimerization subunit type 1 TsaB [Marinicella sediminis]